MFKIFYVCKKRNSNSIYIETSEKKQIVIDKLKYEIENINEVEKKIKK